MADPFITSNRPIVDPKQLGIEIGFVDLLDRSGTVVASWGVHASRCTIGSAQECSVRVEDGNLAPNHVLLIFGKKFTLLKAIAQPTRVAGRQVKEWLIDTSTTIELGELTFVVHPFNSRHTSTVVRGDKLPEVASRMGTAPSQVSNTPSAESRSYPQNPSAASVEDVPEYASKSQSVPIQNEPAVHAQQEAPEVLGQIKENMESLTAIVAALQSNSLQRQMDVQANTEAAILASTQKLMEGFADRWFTDIRRELSTFGNQQQESVSQLSVSLDCRLNSMEQRIETIAASSSEGSRVLTDQISSLANEQSELRNSLSEIRSLQRETPSLSTTLSSLQSGNRISEFHQHADEPTLSRSDDALQNLESVSTAFEKRSETFRRSRMDGSEMVGGKSGDLPGQSSPYYASNAPDPQFHMDQEFGQSIQSASDPEAPYQKAPHAMQWDAPVDDSSDQSYIELLRRLEKNQTEAEKRSDLLLAPDLPPIDSAEMSIRGDAPSNGWEAVSNNHSQIDAPESMSPVDPNPHLASGQTLNARTSNPKTPSEDLAYLRSMSEERHLEPESVDLKQLREGIDSDLIGSRLERILVEATDRRRIPQATENPLEFLQSHAQVPEAPAFVAQSKEYGADRRNEQLSMAEKLLSPSVELPKDLNADGDEANSVERELQALYSSMGLVRNPIKESGPRNDPAQGIPEASAADGLASIDADREQSFVNADEKINDAAPYKESREDEEIRYSEANHDGLVESVEVQSPNQTQDSFHENNELPVKSDASALSSAENNNVDQGESSGDPNPEEESIEDYMQRLLLRVRSGTNSTPLPLPANNRKSSLPSIPKRVTEAPNPSDEVSHSEASSELGAFPASTPLSRPFTSLPTRAANRAPEAKADLDALRELANSNARRAINRSDKRRNSTDLLVNVAVSAFSLACALALVAMNGFRINATFLGMTCAFLVSILWGGDSVRTYLTILRQQKEGIYPGDESSE